MIIILGPEDVKKGKPENLHRLNITIKDVYHGNHAMMEVSENDVILLRTGHDTKILKGPGEKA